MYMVFAAMQELYHGIPQRLEPVTYLQDLHQGSLDYRDGTIKGVPQLTNIIGLDVSIGTMDEDITYFGFRQTTKAEIKKETTISITRKKESLVWDSVFNNEATGVYGRWGVFRNYRFRWTLSEPTVELRL